MKDCQSGENKNEIRQLIKQKRNKTDDDFRQKACAVIEKKVFEMELYKNAKTIMFYMTHESEVKTENIIRRALKENKNVVLPLIVSKEEREISAVQIKDIDADLIAGSYGIREPNSKSCKTINPKDIDLIFVPGIVFDESGHRIGYGKGFYDRWLGKFKVEQRIGLAYDFQVFKTIPKEKNDLAVGIVVTEKRVIKNN